MDWSDSFCLYHQVAIFAVHLGAQYGRHQTRCERVSARYGIPSVSAL